MVKKVKKKIWHNLSELD